MIDSVEPTMLTMPSLTPSPGVMVRPLVVARLTVPLLFPTWSVTLIGLCCSGSPTVIEPIGTPNGESAMGKVMNVAG